MINNQSIILRPANADDIKSITIIEKKLFPFDAWNTKMFQAFLSFGNNATFIIAEKAKKIAGYICMRIIETDAEIDNLAVDSEIQRCGIASMLLKHVIDKAQKHKIEHMYLEVSVDNKPAIELYKKFGFEPLRIRKNYYPYGDALELRLKLSIG